MIRTNRELELCAARFSLFIQVAIDTQLVDDEERLWKSGQRPVIVNIKAFEDPRAAGRANR